MPAAVVSAGGTAAPAAASVGAAGDGGTAVEEAGSDPFTSAPAGFWRSFFSLSSAVCRAISSACFLASS